ncbi:putative D-3-phosphoglycerate dehydrogenase-like, partial [Apostichopus japonicus]
MLKLTRNHTLTEGEGQNELRIRTKRTTITNTFQTNLKHLFNSSVCRDRKYRTYRILKELTIGIIGAGDIGVEVARCCKCFGMKTIGLCKQDRPKEQRSQYIDVYLSGSKLSQLLAESDYICSILPSSPDTDNFFQEDTFSHCTK